MLAITSQPECLNSLIFQQKLQIKTLVLILLLRLDFFSERQRIKSYFPWLDLVLSASLTLIVTKSLDSQHPRTSKEPPGRPHLLRMDSSLEPWQICKFPRRPLLPHTQVTLRIKLIYKECWMLLRTRVCSSELPRNPVPLNPPMTLPISIMCSESGRLHQIRVWSSISSQADEIPGKKLHMQHPRRLGFDQLYCLAAHSGNKSLHQYGMG